MAFAHFVANDTRYHEVCADLAHARLAVGGDSHCSRMANAMRSIPIEGGIRMNGAFNFAEGGMTLMRYRGVQRYFSLRQCNANVALLFLGGNDLDMPRPRERRDVISDFLNLFLDLEASGKVVYVVGIPNRWSRRNQNLQMMQHKISYINLRLKWILKGRFISMPSFLYREDSFERQVRHAPVGPPIRVEMVHLLPQYYTTLAKHVLQRVTSDLRRRKSPQSRIERTINHFLSGH